VTAVREHRVTPPAATVGIWFVSADDDRAVLKVLEQGSAPDTRWPADADEHSPYYWRREPLAYREGVVFSAPRCRAVVSRPDGTVALWLDDAGDAPAWTPELLGAVAGRVGAAQAAPPRDDRWLAHGWLRRYLELHGVAPDAVLERLEALPQALCHHDLHPGNVIGPDAGTIVDWAYCGHGARGTDPGVLLADGIADEAFPAADADAVADAVWDGYLAGLRDGGWSGDEDDVRFAFVHGTRLRLSWLPRGARPAWDATSSFLERLASAT
jgi:phosphotransferase family enzyme